MPVASVVPDTHAGGLRRAPDRHRALEARRVEARRLSALRARTPTYFGGAPKTDTLRARIIAEPSTAVAEYESGNVDILADPRVRSVGLAGRREPQAAAHVHAGARARVRRHQHHARPARRRARAPGDQLRDRHRSHHRATGRRTRHARRRRHPARARRVRQHAQAVSVRSRQGEAAARRRRPSERHRHRALDLADADLSCASPRRCRRTSTPSAFASRSCSAKPPPRAAPRAKARRT